MASFEPIMAPYTAAGRITGADIIQDLCDRVAEKLSKNCDLRLSDSYCSYSATVEIKLQATDFDSVAITENINVGTVDPAREAYKVTTEAVGVSADEVHQRLGLTPDVDTLERPVIVADEETTEPAQQKRRHYTPRGAEPKY